MKKRIALIIIVVMPIALLAYGCHPLYMFIDIPPHVGDGEFQNVSRRDGPLVFNAYRIISQRIDLSKDHEQKTDDESAAKNRHEMQALFCD